MELITYKCPNCGGPITFNSVRQQFKCEFCESVFTEQQLEEYNKIFSEQNAQQEAQTEVQAVQENEVQEDDGEQLEGFKAYICKSCGAQIIADETTSATQCPYCNNPIIVAPQLSGGNKPDLIIPFKVQKKDAIAALKKFYKGKFLLPKVFTDENKINEIKGVYVPFWLYDCEAQASLHFTGEKIVGRHEEGDYEIIQYACYDILRQGSLKFSKVPVDGSTKMDDSYMDAIEPYNYEEMVGFNAAYLSGYLADRYDVDKEKSRIRAEKRVENTTEVEVSSTVTGYDNLSHGSGNVQMTGTKVNYALLPVWILNTKFKRKKYTFMVNGQTGKIIGKLPIDNKKANKLFYGIAAALAVIGQVVLFFAFK